MRVVPVYGCASYLQQLRGSQSLGGEWGPPVTHAPDLRLPVPSAAANSLRLFSASST